MNITVVDDQEYYIHKITNILKEHFPDDQLYSFYNVTELMNADIETDILLLDIEMPEITGIEFLKQKEAVFPAIIFVSSHEELIIDCFGLHVTGFVVKSRMDRDLVDKVEHAKELIGVYLELDTETGLRTFNERDVVYFYSEYEMVYAKTVKDNIRLTTTSLSCLETQASDSFFRINRNTLVNLHHIKSFVKGVQEVKITNGDTLSVSERRWRSLLLTYNKVVSMR